MANDRLNQVLEEQPGTYNVQITQHDCTSCSANRLVETSALAATDPNLNSYLTIYPNPAEHILSVQYTNPLSTAVRISIVDMNGVSQPLLISFKAQNSQIDGIISVQTLPTGVYIVKLTDGRITVTGRFMKKKPGYILCFHNEQPGFFNKLF